MSATLIPDACSVPTAAVTTTRKHRSLPRRVHRVPCMIRVVADETPASATKGDERASGAGERQEVISGRTVNISAAGVAIQTGEMLHVGTQVEVMMAQSGDAYSSMFGKVVHSRRVQAGAFEIGVAIGAGR